MDQKESRKRRNEASLGSKGKASDRRGFLRAGAAVAVGAALTTPRAAAAQQTGGDEGGVLISDDRGALYFLPAKVIQEHRLDGDRSREMLSYLSPNGVTPIVSALRGDPVVKWRLAASETTTVSVANTAAIRRTVG